MKKMVHLMLPEENLTAGKFLTEDMFGTSEDLTLQQILDIANAAIKLQLSVGQRNADEYFSYNPVNLSEVHEQMIKWIETVEPKIREYFIQTYKDLGEAGIKRMFDKAYRMYPDSCPEVVLAHYRN